MKSPSGLSFERRAQLLESEQERLRQAIIALEDLRAKVDAERRQDVELTIARLREALDADGALTGRRCFADDLTGQKTPLPP
jgi:hypothetical protein